jgi:hypothetical protein
MAGHLKAKHVDWNPRLLTTRARLLRDYPNKNVFWIYSWDTPIISPYNPCATSFVLDIVLTKSLVTPVYLTACSELSFDKFPVLIDTRRR